VLNDIHEPEVAEEVLQSWEMREGMTYRKADCQNRSEVDRMFSSLNSLPDIVVVNAGVVAPQPFLETTPENWDFHLGVNLTGAFHIAQVAAQRWVQSGQKGHLIFTSSWVQDVPQGGISAYCVSKSGLKMLAKTIALELGAYGIRANLIAPGIVDAGLSGKLFREGKADPNAFTQHIPLATLQTAEQVAEVFWLLAQPAADYITGATLLADGGMSLFQF
jgi:NAD(P)-dependent dehydrogenase (short-subunit alcohol dehydrogenase family)